MNSQHQPLVLVLFSVVGSVVFLIAGCAGVAEPAPSLAVAPSQLTVSAKVGTSSSLPVTLTNTGATELNVSQALLSGTGFSMNGLTMPLHLPAGQSATFRVKFAASKVGDVSGSVEFMTDSQHRPAMLPLHGTGASLTPEVSSILVSPAVATPAPSAKVQFTASVQGATTNDAVTWAASIGTISGTGIFTAPALGGVGKIIATSVADPTKSATATVSVAAPPQPPGSAVTSVTVSPATVSSSTGATLSFRATVTGTTQNIAVTWKALLGTITSTGSYTAPAKAGTDLVTATSVADPTKSATATVSVAASPQPPGSGVTSVTVSPATVSSSTGATLSFRATVTGTTQNIAVTWKALLGTITSTGNYTAPAKAGTDLVTATSVADPTKSATATVSVAASPQPPGSGVTSVTVSPATASSSTGATLSFKAAVEGTTSNTAVTWKALLGTITSTGGYTAPAKAGTDTVTATSVADRTKSGSASITVTTKAPTPTITSVTVSPATSTVKTGGSLKFTAAVQGTSTDKSVTWTAALGTINASGAYTAPGKAGTDTVTATSNAEGSKSAAATVTVTGSTPAPPPNPPTPSSGTSCRGSNCAAFPGAEGGGAAAAGGRGGAVIEVTNLNDSGSGSLRACVDASGPRTCVFRIGGNIVNHSRLQVSNPYLTIAGQTAPGDGITIGGSDMNGAALFINTHDVIVRYLTCDGDNPNTPTGPDTGTVCFEATSGAHDVIWDHISMRWWGNKGFISYSNDTSNVNNVIRNLSLQWALVYEPNLMHPVGPGTDAAAWPAEAINQDFHHILFANVGHRIPEVATPHIRFVSNIIYNFNYFASEPNAGVSMDFIDNKYVAGNMNVGNSNPHPLNVNSSPGTNCLGHCDLDGVAPSIYMSGNVGPQGTDFELSCETTSEGGPEGACPIRASWHRSNPLPAEAFPIAADPASSLDEVLLPTVGNSQMLDCSGGWQPRRDSQDARVISQYKTAGGGGLFTGQFRQPSLASGSSTSCIESLHDGLPDQWKSSRGLSTSDPNLYKAKAPNGYTWLENYLNGE